MTESEAEIARLRLALKRAADALLWAGSALSHAWAAEVPPDKESADEAYEAEERARAVLGNGRWGDSSEFD